MRSIRPMEIVDDGTRPRLARHARLKFDAARGQYALLSPEAILVLNDTGVAIVELCDSRRTIAEIQEELRSRYGHVAEGDVGRFVTALIGKHGMEIDHG
jgi:pyrroloquinoline quinone biosynthesis protein D